MTRSHPALPARNAGFSMVEILVTVLVIAVGLLGLAGLQARGMAYNHSAYLRTQATLLAYDMTDRMRANLAGVQANAYNDVQGEQSESSCINSFCDASAMAQFDAYEWMTALASQLPGGSGTVSRNGTQFTITVMWDDDKTGGTDCSTLKCLSIVTEIQ